MQTASGATKDDEERHGEKNPYIPFLIHVLTYVFFFLERAFDHFVDGTSRALGQAGSIVTGMADVLVDDGQMVDDLDSPFFLVRAVTHAGTAAEAQGLAVLHSRSAEIFGAAADADFGTDRQEFDDVVRADRSAFTAACAERLVDDRQAIFAHAHSTERAGTRAVAEAETAEFTEFRALLDNLSSRAVMNTFVFISQFGNAIAAAAFDVSVFRFRSFSDFACQLATTAATSALPGTQRLGGTFGSRTTASAYFAQPAKPQAPHWP